jgi:hypothetical protein
MEKLRVTRRIGNTSPPPHEMQHPHAPFNLPPGVELRNNTLPSWEDNCGSIKRKVVLWSFGNDQRAEDDAKDTVPIRIRVGAARGD